MKKLVVITILLLGSFTLSAQRYEVELQVDDTKNISLELFSEIDGKKLLDLPVTLQLTNKNNLIILFGNGKSLQNEYHVWLFSKSVSLKKLVKSNKTIASTGEFKSRYDKFHSFCDISDGNMQYIQDYEFDNGYEIVSKNPKPTFFKIDKNAKKTTLFLRLYVSKPTKKLQDLFFARAKMIEITIKINE